MPKNQKQKKPQPHKAIELVGSMYSIRTCVDGGVRIAFDIPQSHQAGVNHLMEDHRHGNSTYAIVCVKIKPDDKNVVPLDPVEKVFSETGNENVEDFEE